MDLENNNFNNNTEYKPWGMNENQFCMFLHLSLLTSYIIPIAGIVLPIVMWTTNKDKSRLVDMHGKNVINWIISSFIYVFASLILSSLLIGIPLLILIGICTVIFSITGAIKANEGIIFKYPLTITFIK